MKKKLTIGIILFALISMIPILILGEKEGTRFIVLALFYLIALFYALYSSLNLANVISNKIIVFTCIVIPRTIIFILLSIFADYRMIFIDIGISFFVDKITRFIGTHRQLIDKTKRLSDPTITYLGDLGEQTEEEKQKEGE